MKIVKINNPQAIKLAVSALKKGNLIIYPTETCYGLGADATNPLAIEKLLEYKGMRKGKPISIAVSNKDMAEKYIKFNPTAKNIFQNFLPGPITLVAEGKHQVDPKVESQNGTLGIRVPDYPLVRKIVSLFGKPITATSANVSSGKTPYQIKDILGNINEKKKKLISLIIDAGKLPANPPSTVVNTTLDKPEIIRSGQITLKQLSGQTTISHSAQKTKKLAAKLLKKYFPKSKNRAIIFALQGDLGSGKTQFAKGMGKFLDIKETITSPTFTLVHEYNFTKNKISGTFYHLDIWRIENEKEISQLRLNKMLRPCNIIAIEWMQKGRKMLEKLARQTNSLLVFVDFKHLGIKKRRITWRLAQ